MITQYQFELACRLQAQEFKATGDFGRECNRAVFNATVEAATEVREARHSYRCHLVPTGTGSGKTTFTVSLIAACLLTIEDYTAAFVTPTIEAAQQIHDMLAQLLPESEIALHTSAHASQSTARQHSDSVVRHIQNYGPSTPDQLAACRVAISTHEAWINEGLADDSRGIRYHLSGPRTNIFVDEFPDTVRTHEFAPSDFHALADEMQRFASLQQSAEAARCFATSLDRVVSDSSQRFAGIPLMSTHQLDPLLSLHLNHGNEVNSTSQATFRGLTLAVRGHGFVARTGPKTATMTGQKRVVTYSDVFCGHPGIVVLDATGELEPRIKHGATFKVHAVPRAIYPNLATTHVGLPSEFEGVAVTRMSGEVVGQYAHWIVSEIIRADSLNDQTLIVVHKRVEVPLRVEISRRRGSAGVPFVTHWGCDVGSNAYRTCNNVFLIGEFHQPRHAYLAKWLGSTGRTAHPAELRSATGQYSTGGVKDVENTHLLRAFKQMASRGTARDLREDGVAAQMRLFTTMDRTRLLPALLDLFPGAPMPHFIRSKSKKRVTKGTRLASFLLESCRDRTVIELSAQEITQATGIAGKDVKRAFASRECEIVECLGWTFLEGEGRRQQIRLSFRSGPSANLRTMPSAA